MKERYVWLVEITHQEEWRYVSMEDGVQCVTMDGIEMMLEWCVDNLDYQLHVRIISCIDKDALHIDYCRSYSCPLC